MKWKHLYCIHPNTQLHQGDYSAVPCALNIDKSVYRIFYSYRDPHNRSRLTYADIDILNPTKILNKAEKPIISLGDLGTFDDSGTLMNEIVAHNGKYYLYYVGWNLGVTVPFRNSMGLAISNDGGTTFKKAFVGPIMDRTKKEPHFVASCSILIENNIWRMWYQSCVKWEMVNGQPKHFYHIKYAESTDGINWKRDGKVAIDFLYPEEYAISTPRVIKENNKYKMWYSYRGSPFTDYYRIGYAVSEDGLVWLRKDSEVGIDVSSSGWASKMIEYPYVFTYEDKKYMLYNGNGYGKTGIGLAVLS